MAGEQPRAHHDFETVIKWLYELRAHGYYGGVELKLMNGQIVDVRPTPMCKPGEELPIVRPRKKISSLSQ